MKMIKFTITVSKWSNFYFFLQNLSEWHISNLPFYNKAWRERFNFDKNKEELLADFREIRRGWPPSNSIFEKSFYLSDDPFKTLGEELNEKQLSTLEKVFDAFKPEFETIYKEEGPKLEQWKRVLEASLNDTNLQTKIINDLEIFYNERVKSEKELKLFLNLSTDTHNHSGSYINKDLITQELSSFSIDNKSEIVATVWHEVIHAYFDKFYFRELVEKFESNDRERDVLKEVVASSLFPKGILAKKYFNLELTTDIYRRYELGSEKTKKIMELTKEYIDSKLIMDLVYLNKLKNILQK